MKMEHINFPGSKYDGLDRYEARKLIVEDLNRARLLSSNKRSCS